MFLTLLLISSSDFVYGNEIFLISINQHADLAPINSSYIFQAPSNLYLELQSGKSGPIQQSQFLQLSNTTSQLRSFFSELDPINIWHIPFTKCPPGGNAYFTSDRIIAFESDTKLLKKDFCLFPQTNVYAQEFSGSFFTDSPSCKLEFYEGSHMKYLFVQHFHHHYHHDHHYFHKLWALLHHKKKNITSLLEPRYIAKPNVPFHFSFYDPFFIRFTGCAGYYLNTSFISSVMRPGAESEDCSVGPIPAISKTGGMKMSNPMGFVNITQCENTASTDVLTLFLASGALFAFTIGVVVLFLLPKKKHTYRNPVRF